MKRILSAILCVILLLSAAFTLGACNKEEEEAAATTVTAGGDGTADLYGDLPKGYYDDYEFNILNNISNYGLTTMDAEDSSTNINAAIYQRNRYIEQELGIKFKVTEQGYDECKNTISNLVGTATHTYDICYNESWAQAILSQQGIYISTNSYAEYLNLDKPWWYKDDMDNLTIADNSFFLIGDMQMMWNDSTWCLAFNKDILDQHGVDNPYELVTEGTWTLEVLNKMTEDTRMDGGDEYRYGVVSHIGVSSAFLAGGGVELVERTNEGKLKLTTADDYLINVYTDVLNYFFKSNGEGMNNWIRTSYDSASWNGGNGAFPDKDFQGRFLSGNAVFMGGTVGDMRTYLPSSEINYGIVPMPKYDDELQSQYTGLVYEGGAVCGIPMTMPSKEALERTCTVLEWLGAYSYQMLKPVYYDEIIKARTANDPESAVMLDIVFGYDQRGKTVMELDNIFRLGTASAIQLRISDASTAIKSAISGQSIIVNAKLEDIYEYYGSNGEY